MQAVKYFHLPVPLPLLVPGTAALRRCGNPTAEKQLQEMSGNYKGHHKKGWAFAKGSEVGSGESWQLWVVRTRR